MNPLDLSPDELRTEYSKLRVELDEISQQKDQAAQYGLQLIEDQSVLKDEFTQLQELFEATKHERDCAKEALGQIQLNMKTQTAVGVSFEDALLKETASSEALLQASLDKLQMDFAKLKQTNERLEAEKDNLNDETKETQQQKENMEDEQRRLRKEVKDYKWRETRMLADYSELEEENIHLQKQVSMLKHNQIEFEGMKHMNKRLQEDINDLQCHIDELNNLKRISEKQVEECLENLKIEREQRHALKKEMDQKRDQESLLQLSKMHQFDNNQHLNFSDQDMDSSLHNLEQDLMNNEGSENDSSRRRKPSPPRNNLFSVVGELEERLEKTETEKRDLEKRIDEYHSSLKTKAEEIAQLTAKLNSNNIAKNIDSILNDIPGGDVSPPGDFLENGVVDADSNNQVNSQHHVLVLKRMVKEQEKKYLAALQQISEMEQRLSTSTSAPSLSSSSTAAISSASVCPAPDLAQLGLAWQVKNYEEKLLQLKKELNAAEKTGSESTAQLKSTQHELYEISQEISAIYNLCCFAVGKPPNKSLADQVKRLQEDKKSWENVAANAGEEVEEKEEKKDAAGVFLRKEAENHRLNHERALEAIREQMKYLKRVAENVSEIAREKASKGVENGADADQSSDAAELTEQVGKLKSLLSTKREQIATLRTVLKANKHTAEVALANLKGKYENEKSIVTETMLKLRNELKVRLKGEHKITGFLRFGDRREH